MLSFITWTADPVAFTIPFIERDVRWYGIAFALGFLLGLRIVRKIWKHEQLNEDWYDKLFIYVVIATAVGARLGHCLFYGADGDFWYYYKHPFEIIKIWEGGLASHGGTLGIIIAIWIYSKKVTHKSLLWTFDRLVVPVGFVAALIRFGNLMNHEIYGHATNLPWAFRFIENIPYWERGAIPIFSEPSHPTQLYEAFFYILTAFVCLWMYWKREDYKSPGLIFGVFLIGIFLSRFFIEFFKEIQVGFEEGMLLNMGQLLSLPFIIAGIWFASNGLREKKKSLAKNG
ncbi:MAG: prolipoprotein diacylglyceryl transferase [Candidatus Symbiothrix sp.]|jgi:prolipoprotein diacylglyceryl transferase|nr:prolipoprotein diacylglyceryl transferase [Candidatus Symbiothrix sp.]